MKRKRDGGNEDAKSKDKGASRGARAKDHLMSDEDHALWSYTAHGTEPLRKAKSRVPIVGSNDDAVSSTAKSTRSTPGRDADLKTPSRRHPLPQRPARAEPAPPRPAPPPIQPFDRKRQRRIASGQLEIEARLDLHGSRQAEAHHSLRAFLLRAASKGYATVLVVTGKGGPLSTGNSTSASTDAFGREPRGVLRRMVPFWLEEPELRAIVAGYTTAAIQHGGEGALYIHLRRRTPR